MTRCAGVLLTGGASRRMGSDKATLVVRGEMLATRVATVLRAVCDPAIEVGPGVTTLPHVVEQPAGSGPLAALLAGVDALGIDGPVVGLACDLPFIDVATLRRVAEAPGAGSVVPTVDERPQYACARWSAAALRAGRAAWAQGERALRCLLDADDVTFLEAGDWGRFLVDLDTPDDIDHLGLS